MIWARFVLYTHEKGRFSLSFPSRISTTTPSLALVLWVVVHLLVLHDLRNTSWIHFLPSMKIAYYIHTVMYITIQVVQNTVFCFHFLLLLMMRLLRWFICIDADSVMVNFLPGSHVFGVSLSRSPTQKTLCGLRVCWRRTFFPTNKSGQVAWNHKQTIWWFLPTVLLWYPLGFYRKFWSP